MGIGSRVGVGSLCTAACFALGWVSPRSALAAETTLDDFEGASSPSPWVFYNGNEFPGATGSLTSGTGHAGKGAHLAFDLSAGGKYVSATLTLAQPKNAAAVAYWVKAAGNIHAKLRVRDTSGQTLQYDVSRPLEAFDATAWYRQVVELDAPSSHYGGANDGVVHQPLTAVTIMAADPIEAGAVGAIDVDDVSVFDPLAPALDPLAPGLVPAPSGAADLASRLAVNIHFTHDDQALDIAAAAGFSTVRMDLGWSGVEHAKGTYDFTALDGLVASLATRSMRLHLILDYFDALYPAADSPDFATTTVPAFAAMAKAAAQHFAGKNVTYEIWNEPNLDTFWPPTASATQYAALAAAAIAAVHQGDANAKVSTAGISGFDFAFLRTYLTNGGAAGADAIGIHPYRQGGPESLSDDALWMRSVVGSALSPAPPLWDTEWGYSSTWYGDGHDPTTRKIQAVRVARELLSAWGVGFPLVVYYDIRDDGTDPTNGEHNFGLVQNDYTDKPAIAAVRALSSVAKGRTFAGWIPMTPSSLHAMRLDGVTSDVVALWSDAPNAEIPVAFTVAGNATAVDLSGAAVPITAQGSGTSTVTVREADGPVYLTFSRPSANDGGPSGILVTDAGLVTMGNGGATQLGNGGASSIGGGPGRDAGSAVAQGGGPSTEQISLSTRSGCGCRMAEPPTTQRQVVWTILLGLVVGRRRRGSRRRRIRTATLTALLAPILLACSSSSTQSASDAGSPSGGSGGVGTTTGTGGTSSNSGGAAGLAGAASGSGGSQTQNTGGASAGGGAASSAGGSSGAAGVADAGSGCASRPDATNTGSPKGLALTIIDQDVTAADNTIIDGVDIHGFLVIKGSHVTVRNSIVRGGPASSNGAGIVVKSGTDILIEDTEVSLTTPSVWLDGVWASNATLRRVNVHGGVDGMKLDSNSTVECSYIHDETSFASDPNQNGGPTHNDAIQILSGTGIRIANNQLLAAKDQNSAIQVTEDFGAVSDLTIVSNYADGGGCTFNFSHKGANSLTVTVKDNRFGRNSFYDCPILESTKTTLVASGNVWDDDSTAVPVQTHD